jgi:hypothetical protein
MSTNDFVQKAFQNSNSSIYAQQAFDAIAGVQGVRYTRALDYLPGAQATFTPADIQAATQAQKRLNELADATDRVKVGFMQGWLSGKYWDTLMGLINPFSKIQTWKQLKDKLADDDNQYNANYNYKPVVALRNGVPFIKGTGLPAWQGPMQDPMQFVLDAQNRDFAIRDQERNQRVIDSERSLMTIGDRFASISHEMRPLADQIAQYKKALETPEGFLTAAQKQSLSGVAGIARTIQVNELRQKNQDELGEMEMRYNKDKSDLRQAPLNFQADNLAKVGLYSANALRFNPVLGIEKTNQLLEKIVHNTSKPTITPPRDPHRP